MAKRRRTSVAVAIRTAPRRFYRRSSRGESGGIPLAVVAGFVPAAMDIYDGRNRPTSTGGIWGGIGHQAVLDFIGYNTDNKQFYPGKLVATYLPIVLGMVAHRIANKLGINRKIRAFGSPIVI